MKLASQLINSKKKKKKEDMKLQKKLPKKFGFIISTNLVFNSTNMDQY